MPIDPSKMPELPPDSLLHGAAALKDCADRLEALEAMTDSKKRDYKMTETNFPIQVATYRPQLELRCCWNCYSRGDILGRDCGCVFRDVDATSPAGICDHFNSDATRQEEKPEADNNKESREEEAKEGEEEARN